MRIENNVSAADLLKHFNHFHDGFVKKFAVVSQNRFNKRKLVVMYDMMRVEIRFAHNNYAQGNRPYGQVVRAVFTGVEELQLSVLKRSDATVMRVDISEQDDSSYRLVISYPDNKKPGKLVAGTVFTFRSAVFTEIPRSGNFPPEGVRIGRPGAL